MAWTTVPYCTPEEVIGDLDLQTVQDGSYIAGLVAQAQQAIDTYLGFSFQTDGTPDAPATRFYDGNGAEQLPIDDCLQLVTVLETVWTVSVGADGSYTRTSSTRDITADCVLGPAFATNSGAQPGFLLERYSGIVFSPGRRNYQVRGVFGWAGVPADINRACRRLAVHYYRTRDAGYTDETGEAQFGRKTYRAQMPKDVVDTLDAYRRTLFLGW